MAADTLRVPPGHPLAGQPMELLSFAVEFLRAGWDAHESALSVARKNAKSAVCAVLALGFQCGRCGALGGAVGTRGGLADKALSRVERGACAALRSDWSGVSHIAWCHPVPTRPPSAIRRSACARISAGGRRR